MKFIHAVLIVIILLVLDQWLKFNIKTNFTLYQEKNLIGNWAKLHFIENEGMAFGLSFGGEWGKIALTLFRLVAGILGFFFIYKLIQQKYNNLFIFCCTLVLAGALGNLIDCLFYGKIFTESGVHGTTVAKLVPYGQGYGKFLHGKVVDMLYFPIIETQWPTWVPIIGGRSFTFFNMIFNLADAYISTGIIAILLFQGYFIKRAVDNPNENPFVQATSGNETGPTITETEQNHSEPQ